MAAETSAAASRTSARWVTDGLMTSFFVADAFSRSRKVFGLAADMFGHRRIGQCGSRIRKNTQIVSARVFKSYPYRIQTVHKSYPRC